MAQLNPQEIEDATWGEVLTACCTHSPQEWGLVFLGASSAFVCLYFFLFGLDLLGAGAKVLGACTAGSMFGDDTNPVAALMIGVFASVFLLTSSTATSIVVALVGANTVSARIGIFMAFGANIGTTLTNTIVAIGQMNNVDQLELAFAGATVHDMFNYMNVALFLPLEAATGVIYHMTKAMVKNASTGEGQKWEGPIKKYVGPLTKKIIVPNKGIIEDVAFGAKCSDFYPINCTDPSNPTYKTCDVGLLGCDKTATSCPAFFSPDATQNEDTVSGLIAFLLGLAFLFICLYGFVSILQKMLLGTSMRIIYKATNINGYIAIPVGCLVTMLVQSSSITTSALTPLVGMGIIRLEQMYPLSLGANIGTCITALLAALVQEGTESLQVALAHLFFILFGVCIWYPIPFLRQIPLTFARLIGRMTRIWKFFPFLYILV